MSHIKPLGKAHHRSLDIRRRAHFLSRPLLVAFNDWCYGRQNGKADAAGRDMAGADGVPHAERLIDAQAERAALDRRRELRDDMEAAHKVREDAVLERDHAEREGEQLDIQGAELAEREATLGRRHGLGRGAYGLALVALAALALPIDYGVASWLPLPPVGQWLLAVCIGAAMLVLAHLTAERIEELEETHGERERRPFAFRKDQLAVAAGLGVAAAVLVVTAIWRGQVLAAEARATEASIPSGMVSLALGALAALAFVAAVLAGMSYRRMAPLRAVRKQRARLVSARAKLQAAADQAVRRQREAEVTLVYMAEREQQVPEAVRHWAEERKARLRQRTAWVSLKASCRLAGRSSARGSVGTVVSTERMRRGSTPISQTTDTAHDVFRAR